MEVDPLSLLYEQLALERKGVDSSGRLFRLPGDNPDDMGRVLTVRLADGRYVAYFRDDLPDTLVAALSTFTTEQLYQEQDRVLGILGATRSVGSFLTYFFSESPRQEDHALVIEREDRFFVEVDGVVTSEAWSSRSTDFAAELAVETRPEFRRRGYGRQVCAAWANRQLRAGRTAFYSHNAENVASAALARSLGVQHVFDIVSYE
jgi:GNAT superfamily N-acetyltransferase